MASIVRIADIIENDMYVSDLEMKAADAQRISSEIGSLVGESRGNLVGDVYDAFRSNLDVYQVAYSKLSQVCSLMASSISTIDSGYSDYIYACTDDDPVNARDHIPKYEEEINQLRAENERLEAEIAELEKVPPKITVFDEESQSYKEVDNPEYPPAQAQIAIDKAQIAANLARIAQLEEWLEYLRRLDGEVDPWAVSSIEGAANECLNFKSQVGAIKVTNIS